MHVVDYSLKPDYGAQMKMRSKSKVLNCSFTLRSIHPMSVCTENGSIHHNVYQPLAENNRSNGSSDYKVVKS